MQTWIALLAAASMSQVQWPQEPTALLGVPLGGEVEGVLPKCKALSMTPPQSPCYRRDSYSSVYTIEGHGLRFASSVVALTKDKVVTSILITGDHAWYSQAKDTFTQRFGPPHQRKETVVTNRVGAKFPAETSYWIGQRTALSLLERSGKVDTWSLILTSQEDIERSAEERQLNARDDAAKL